MRVLLDSEQMNYCDRNSIAESDDKLIFMKRAAKAVADTAVTDFVPDKVLCICGTGNNGGDGIIAATVLCDRGYDAEIYLPFGEEAESSVCRELLREAKMKCVNIVEEPNFSDYTLIIDAIFGTGISRNITGFAFDVIDSVNNSGTPVLSIDIPSGIFSDNGKKAGIAINADATVSMQTYKTGHVLSDGINASGELSVADIGIDISEFMCGNAPLIITDEDLSEIPKRPQNANKGTFGRVLVIASSVGMCGAAYFAAKAAYRSGAGLVEVFVPEENRTVIQTLLPEAIVSCYKSDEFISDDLLYSLDRATVVVLGPGLGRSYTSRKIVKEVYESINAPLIIDADALNITAEEGFSYPTDVPVIITPHPGELSGLTGKSIQTLTSALIDEAKQYAAENDIICVAKNARTVVTDGMKTYINMSGGPELSKGGSGDVLCGVIAGMLCADLSPLDAAAYGVYIHGRAGDALAEKMGEFSPLAREVADAVTDILKNLR